MDPKEIILKEYELHRNELQMRFNHGIKVMGTIFGGLLAAFALGVEKKIGTLVVIIPWLSGFLIVYTIHHYMVIRLTVAYLSDLERRLGFIDYERCVANIKWMQPVFWKNPIKIEGFCFLVPYFVTYIVFLYETWQFTIMGHPSFVSFLLSFDCVRLYFLKPGSKFFGFLLNPKYMAVLLVSLPTVFVFCALLISAWGISYASKLPEERQYEGFHVRS